MCRIDRCERRVFARGWCSRHYRAWRNHGDPMHRPPTIEERFWPRVRKTGTCWLWMGGCTPEGYGMFKAEKQMGAHRYAYELLVGPIPPGLQLDHLCRVPRCVNPDHLEPVTNRENSLRGTSPLAQNARKSHCPQGHPYDEENTYHYDGERHCRECGRIRNRAQKEWKTNWQRERRQRRREMAQ